MSRHVVGLWSGHDTSFCHLVDGRPAIHTELERHTRVKEDVGDAYGIFQEYAKSVGLDERDVTLVSCYPEQKLVETARQKTLFYGHHQAHAAHAFYSSNLDNALVITIDGGGVEQNGIASAFTVWVGHGTQLEPLTIIPDNMLNIGMIWTRVTRYVFGLESGWPYGHQAGTVMAMAALGDASKHIDVVRTWFNTNTKLVQSQAPGAVRGMSARDQQCPRHPYLGQFKDMIKENSQTAYDLAASFQQASEENIVELVSRYVYLAIRSNRIPVYYNLCLAGGVSLNSLTMGRLRKHLPGLNEIYIPPVPYDAGLSIGSAQYHYHHVLGNPRIPWEGSFSPFLGRTYSVEEIKDAVSNAHVTTDKFNVQFARDPDVIDLLEKGDIISVFNGGAESGRRALGNRSILADPRKPEAKDRVNEKVKHRQWFRPFAPSVLAEKAGEWFEGEIDSPYMSFVAMVKDDKKSLIPAVTHFDGTARLQTVQRATNPWYYDFIAQWDAKTGVPVVLDTSFNDSEPIVEHPKHAINCFLKTDIDALYFPQAGLLLKKC